MGQYSGLTRTLLLAAVSLSATIEAPAAPAPGEIDRAFQSLYNFDFAASHKILDAYIAAHPDEPLPYSVRASAYLFAELHRLGILEGEFFEDDKRIAEKKKMNADPAVRRELMQALEDAQSRAGAVLEKQPADTHALFTMCVASGVRTDYTALVEKRQIRSLSMAKSANRYAQQLLKVDPNFYDAYLTAGLSEYLVGSLPFVIRWFVRFDNVKGSKEQGIRNVQLVAERGRYLRPFAKILLSIAYLREKKPRKTQQLLVELARDYPANPLIRKELVKVEARVAADK
jgi:hypothetical protein